MYSRSILDGQDLSNRNLAFEDFSYASLKNANLDDANLEGANFEGANLEGATFRRCNLKNANFCKTNLWASVLEDANLQGVKTDEETKWWKMYCPEKGAFLGYKKCVNDRLVQLLIPEDARRSSSTRNCCRCDKAKVLTIKSFDYQQEFDEAWSLVDEDFVYKKGEWVVAHDFHPSRWWDSAPGIHFWMTREEAKKY